MTRFDRIDAAFAALAVLACGIAALAFGQSIGWDLRNYHLYAPWAWWTGRDALDLVPAQLQSFYNPLLHAPIAGLALHAPPALTTFALGAVAGLNIPLLALLVRALERRLDARRAPLPRGLSWAVAAVGGLGATSIGELGATQGDTFVTLPMLAGLVLLLESERTANLVAAGVLLGLAVGLKLTLAPLILGFGLALPLLGISYPRIALFALAGMLGFALTAAPWMLTLAARYGNPLFPYLAALMPSPYDLGASGADPRFRPDGVIEAIFYPLRWLADWRAVSDLKFRDLRIALFAVALPWLVLHFRPVAAMRWLLAAFVIGYAAWAALFGYYRYLALWEMLALPILVLALWQTVAGTQRDVRGLSVLLGLVVISTNPPNWGHKRHGAQFVDIDLASYLPPASERPMLLMAGDSPLAYLVLRAPPGTPAVRISSNFHGPPRAADAWDRRAAERIARHDGALVLLHQSGNPALLDTALARQSLAITQPCVEIAEAWRTRGEPAVLVCRVLRR